MDNRPSPINGLVSNHLHHLVVTPMPIAVVVRRVGIQVTVAVALNVAVGRTAAISAAGNRPFVARRGTILRHREGTTTRQQYCRHHDAF
jgi:hypothetical protein